MARQTRKNSNNTSNEQKPSLAIMADELRQELRDSGITVEEVAPSGSTPLQATFIPQGKTSPPPPPDESPAD